MGAAPGGRWGEAGEGRAKSSNISTRPGAQNRHQEEEMDMDRQETLWGSGEGPQFEGGGCVTPANPPLRPQFPLL